MKNNSLLHHFIFGTERKNICVDIFEGSSEYFINTSKGWVVTFTKVAVNVTEKALSSLFILRFQNIFLRRFRQRALQVIQGIHLSTESAVHKILSSPVPRQSGNQQLATSDSRQKITQEWLGSHLAKFCLPTYNERKICDFIFCRFQFLARLHTRWLSAKLNASKDTLERFMWREDWQIKFACFSKI